MELRTAAIQGKAQALQPRGGSTDEPEGATALIVMKRGNARARRGRVTPLTWANWLYPGRSPKVQRKAAAFVR